MTLSAKAIADFAAICREDHGVTLSDDEARELAAGFFELMLLIGRPLPAGGCGPADGYGMMTPLTRSADRP